MTDRTSKSSSSEQDSGSKGSESLPEFFPQYQHYTLTQEEYIRALEQSVQLLQREVERLRSQHPPIASIPVDQIPGNEEALQYTIQLIKFSNSPDEILQQLHRYLSRRFPVLNSAMFLFQNTTSLQAISADPSNSLQPIADHFMEEGIIDWVMNNRRTVIIPDIHDKEENALHYIVVPLFLRGTKLGFFLAQTSAKPAELSNEDLRIFTVLAESAAVAIDNIRSASEIQRMNQRLQELNRQLIQSAKLASLGELAATVAHEINNPLQILLGHIQLLENGIGDPKARMRVIKQQVYRIRDITRHLLQLARSGQSESQPQPVNIIAILRSVLSFLSAQFQRDGIEIITDFDSEASYVLGHATQLEQVLMNILLNARDAMPNGGTLTISTATLDDHHIAILIQDTGIGIPSDHLPRLFDPFFTTKPPGKGTGLGLAISREIIYNHRGTITITSQVGKGTTVKILLPLIAPPQSASTTTMEQST